VNAAEWEELLLSATQTVWKKVRPLAQGGSRGRSVGVGAAGDRTIFADKVAEDILLKALTKRKTRALSEEAGLVEGEERWPLAVVDPLDGSSNFERGIPFYCTSVAITEGDSVDDIAVGVVRDLVNGDVYTARRGKGAKKNGKTIRTSRTNEASRAVVGVDLSRSSPSLVSGLSALISGVKRQVHLGANALELCFLAEGRTDAFVDLRGRMRITDFAAAYLILAEAGGSVTDSDGRKLELKYDLEHRFSFVASGNSKMHEIVLELCRGSGQS
jgi:myo-inositol-1(or 4)-monophosphatase